ncbi:MAG TPA: DinB family protein [Bryobacteraceae bacterium]|nr:DinB family protein [Bryobacteraceae bacterium]
MHLFKTTFATLAFAGAMFAQSGGNPLVASSQGLFHNVKGTILQSVDEVPANLWDFRPTPEVRTFGQLFAHIADGQYEFCGAATGDKPANPGVEKTAKSKEEVVAALKKAFDYCDAAYQKITPAGASETVNFFGNKMARITVMDFNIAHTDEHYGNLVTYMRLKGIVPPTSQPRK